MSFSEATAAAGSSGEADTEELYTTITDIPGVSLVYVDGIPSGTIQDNVLVNVLGNVVGNVTDYVQDSAYDLVTDDSGNLIIDPVTAAEVVVNTANEVNNDLTQTYISGINNIKKLFSMF